MKELNKQIDAVVLIDVPEEEIVKRISSRRVCPNCGKVYNLITLKPKMMNSVIIVGQISFNETMIEKK